MSLLMEALRKAEAAKRAGQQGAASEDPSAATMPDQASVPDVFKFTTSEDLAALSPRTEEIADVPGAFGRQSEQVPVSTTTDDVLDDYLSTQQEPEHDEAESILPSRDRIKVQQQRDRKAAASMFDAKAPTMNESATRQRSMQVLAASLIVVSLGIAGGWLYLASTGAGSGITVNPDIAANAQNRGFLGEGTSNATAATPTGVAAPTAAAPDATTAAVATAPANAPAAVVPATVIADNTARVEPNPAVVPPVETPAATESLEATPLAAETTTVALAVSDPQPQGPVEQDPLDAEATAAGPVAAADTAAPATTLQISRSTTASKIQPALQAAYDQLMQGDLGGANQLYQEVLSQAANNRDALLGLAAVQLQLGNQNEARATYGRLLQLNPQDALARTGLLQTLAGIDPAAYEEDLQALQQRFPTLAPLNFALGNLYAGSGRWHQAQSAYFDALLQARRDGNTSADYAFNLAVSLEQLGQPMVALQYYKEAESLLTSSKPGFDPMLLRQRLSVLEQQQ